MVSRYVTLIGNVQSGKTVELINFCYRSVNDSKIPVIFILRNIKADLLQLLNRFEEHNNLNNKNEYFLNVKSIYQLNTIDSAVDFLNKCGIIVMLCNSFHLDFIKKVLIEYSEKGSTLTSTSTRKYNVCIDEIDFSIKTRDFKSPTDIKMNFVKNNANTILGATATPFAIFSSEKKVSKIKKMNTNTNYKGIEDLEIKFVEPVIIKNINRFPHCDYITTNKIYNECSKKDKCILLHSVVKEKIYHKCLMDYINTRWKKFTTIIYNGDGILVKCLNRNDSKPPLAKSKSYNQFKQYIRKYTLLEDGTHLFTNYGISEVLQILKDDPEYSHTHISIISGNLASRGISFVSSDYSIHLTDQYFHPSKSSHGENILQSLRILGCYTDNNKLTLWCSKNTWKDILEQHNIINRMVQSCDDKTDWICRIQKINIEKPSKFLTRPRLSKGITWNALKTSAGHYNIGIQYKDSEESEESEDS